MSRDTVNEQRTAHLLHVETFNLINDLADEVFSLMITDRMLVLWRTNGVLETIINQLYTQCACEHIKV